MSENNPASRSPDPLLRSKYTSLFNAILQGFCIIEMIWNRYGQPVDYRFIEVNPAFKKQTGIHDYENKTIREIWPEHENHWFRVYGNIARTGQSAHFELPARYINGWFEVEAFAIRELGNDIVGILFHDITSRKHAEEMLRKSEERQAYLLQLTRDELSAVYNNSLMAILVLQAVRNERSEIVDFKIVFANNALEKEAGRTDLIGKCYAKEFPGVKKIGLFDKMVSVMKDGISVTTEYFYPYDDINKWYSCMFVKMGDSLLLTKLDISERKIAEQLLKENSAMIEGIANSAPDMLYAIKLDSLEQFYSNSRIEQLVKKTQSEIRKMGRCYFESFIHPDDLPHFYANLDELREGKRKSCHSLTYRLLDAHGQLHWISTKSSVYLRNKQGRATHIVGISQDITQQKALEEKNRQLRRERTALERRQQKEILKATLNAQEAERARMAESLHNGLGQVLYGVKTALEQLQPEGDPQKNREILEKSKNLLGMCIQESRKIAHELMPSILDDFGLKAAIRDICAQLKGKTHFNCSFSGVDSKIERYLQLAIYRIVQELALNIVKHADATVAHVKVAILRDAMHVEVLDNGRGFDRHSSSINGIGLKTIESKVKLLHGTMELSSVKGQTLVSIRFPL